MKAWHKKQMIELQVRSMSDVICCLQADTLWSVRDVKLAIQDLAKIPVEEQRLICEATEMLNWEPLSSHASEGVLDITLLRREIKNPIWYGRVTGHKGDGERLAYAPESIRNDRQVVLAAVQNCGSAVQFAGDRFRGDREVWCTAVNNDGTVLRFAPPAIRQDREVVLLAVTQAGETLQWAPPFLRNDVEIVAAAVKSNPEAVQFASPEVLKCTEVTTAQALAAQAAVLKPPPAYVSLLTCICCFK
jgi:hypothetical protein